MKSILTTTALASALVIGTMMGAGSAGAQDNSAPCVDQNCPGKGMPEGGVKKMKPAQPAEPSMQGGEDQSQTMKRKKRVMGTDQNTEVNTQAGVQTQTTTRTRTATQFHFDPNRHERRRTKSVRFRFFFGGYWYPEPYWTYGAYGPYMGYAGRVSCGEGRHIVAERYNRVRVVECNGRIYTYLGRRHGDTFRIMLNSRSGRIVGRVEI